MLWQLHHQYPDGHTEFVAQIELTDDRDANVDLVNETILAHHPPPEGTVFVIGNEHWEHFLHSKKERMN